MMQKIKLIVIGVVGLLVLFTIIGLLIPSSVKISRGVMIDADSATVAQIVQDVHSWPEWMTWLRAQEGSLVSFAEEEGMSSVQWRSLNKKTKGSITIIGIKGDLIQLRHAFPGMNISQGALRIRKVSAQQTEVLWMMDYPLKWYPWERFEGIFMDAMLGRVIEEALDTLKRRIGEIRNQTS
jgi:uncharacterized membrane protein